MLARPFDPSKTYLTYVLDQIGNNLHCMPRDGVGDLPHPHQHVIAHGHDQLLVPCKQ